MQSILDKVPEDLRPRATPDWYKYTEGKFQDWVDQQFTGMTFDMDMQLNGCTTYDYSTIHRPPENWYVAAGLMDHTFTCFGTPHTWEIPFPNFYTDEAGSKKWESYKHGTRIKVTGIIKSVPPAPHQRRKFSPPPIRLHNHTRRHGGNASQVTIVQTTEQTRAKFAAVKPPMALAAQDWLYTPSPLGQTTRSQLLRAILITQAAALHPE